MDKVCKNCSFSRYESVLRCSKFPSWYGAYNSSPKCKGLFFKDKHSKPEFLSIKRLLRAFEQSIRDFEICRILQNTPWFNERDRNSFITKCEKREKQITKFRNALLTKINQEKE